jgi:hypothetical protein
VEAAQPGLLEASSFGLMRQPP